MKKLAIIIDSFSGRYEEWTNKNDGFYYLPLQIDVDQTIYKAGLVKEMSSQDVVKKMIDAKSVKTSMPTPQDTTDMFEKLSKEYENVIYLPVGPALSGTYNASANIAKEYENVHVVKNYLVGEGYEILGNALLKMANEGKSFDEIKSTMDKYVNLKVETYVVPKKIEHLIKSGRLGRTMGLLLQKVNAIPIISFKDNDKLYKKMIKRSWEKAVAYAAEKIVELNKKMNEKIKDYKIMITNGVGNSLLDIALNIIKKANQEVAVEEASVLALAAVGPYSISLSVIKKTV